MFILFLRYKDNTIKIKYFFSKKSDAYSWMINEGDTVLDFVIKHTDEIFIN